jgi:hypothetical protein
VPVPSLRIVFRTKFLAGLDHLYGKGLLDCRGPASAFKDPDVFAATMEPRIHGVPHELPYQVDLTLVRKVRIFNCFQQGNAFIAWEKRYSRSSESNRR